MTKIDNSSEIASSAETPLKLFCWNFQTNAGGWGKGWGGYARQSVLYPLSDDERETGAIYIRADQVDVLAAERDAAIARAEAAEAERDAAIARAEAAEPLAGRAVRFIAAARDLVPALLAERDAAVARAEAAEALVKRAVREALKTAEAEANALCDEMGDPLGSYDQGIAGGASDVADRIARLDPDAIIAAAKREGEG